MIADNQTNILYLADTLPKNYSNFYKKFEKLLKANKVNFQLLENTKDVWAVDYMPIQISEKEFVRFTYNPKYLQTQKYRKTISDTDSICNVLNIETIKSDLIIDGGNVTKTTDKVIMTDRVFLDNPSIEKKVLIKQLENYFKIDKLFFVPEQPKDFTGHSDGMVRFVDNQTVIINDYQKEKSEFYRAFEIAIHNTGLDYIKIPYNPYGNANYDMANGDYINFLQMENILVIPTFGIKEDDITIKQLEEVFKGHKIVTIDGNDIAKDGGVFNCISWNIKQ